jgi:hypothetical protein
MTDRSVPVTLNGKSYHLRFDRSDIKAIENTLGVGYVFFVRPGIWGSLSALESFFWRGLRDEDKKGDLVYTFPQTDEGREQAGEFVFANLAENALVMNDAVFEAFISAGLFRRLKPDEEEEKETDPKNPNPTG